MDRIGVVLLLVGAVSVAGCQTSSYAERGAGFGALAGAAEPSRRTADSQQAEVQAAGRRHRHLLGDRIDRNRLARVEWHGKSEVA